MLYNFNAMFQSVNIQNRTFFFIQSWNPQGKKKTDSQTAQSREVEGTELLQKKNLSMLYASHRMIGIEVKTKL